MFYTLYTTNQDGKRTENIGSFPREEDAVLASKMFDSARVIPEPKEAVMHWFPDFGRFEDYIASTEEYDRFFVRFLDEHEGMEWRDDEAREDAFQQWWYSL